MLLHRHGHKSMTLLALCLMTKDMRLECFCLEWFGGCQGHNPRFALPAPLPPTQVASMLIVFFFKSLYFQYFLLVLQCLFKLSMSASEFVFCAGVHVHFRIFSVLLQISTVHINICGPCTLKI